MSKKLKDMLIISPILAALSAGLSAAFWFVGFDMPFNESGQIQAPFEPVDLDTAIIMAVVFFVLLLIGFWKTTGKDGIF